MSTEALHNSLRQALAAAGNNQSRFAAAIGTSQQLVSYWLSKGRPLPAEFVLPAERAGFGSRHDLRPDLYPREDAPPSASVAACGECTARPDSPEALACDRANCGLRQKEAA